MVSIHFSTQTNMLTYDCLCLSVDKNIKRFKCDTRTIRGDSAELELDFADWVSRVKMKYGVIRGLKQSIKNFYASDKDRKATDFYIPRGSREVTNAKDETFIMWHSLRSLHNNEFLNRKCESLVITFP